MIANNEEKVVGAVSTAMKIATKVAPTVGRLLAVVAVPAALFALPQAALAQNECGLQVGTTPVECDQSSYGSGVTYDAVGDLFIEFTKADGGFSDPARSTIGGTGITLTGDGSESIDFDSATTETEIQNSGTTGPLLGVTTVDGGINIATEEMDADFSGAGVTHAIFAESTGSGSIDIITTANVDARGSNPADSIGIEAVTNTGDVEITVAGDSAFARRVSGNLYAIRTETGGSAQSTVNNLGNIGNNNADMAIRATGGAFTLNNDSTIQGRFDFSGLTGGATFNNSADADWQIFTSGVNNFGSGVSTIENQGQISLVNGVGRTINNSVFDNLDVFNNAGEIEFGTHRAVTGDTLSIPDVAFTGTGDSVLLMDVLLNGTGQTDCASAAAGDCLDVPGGTTGGETLIQVSVVIPDLDLPIPPLTLETMTAPNPGIVLVDVGGGSSAAGDFALSPDSCTVNEGESACASTSIYRTDPFYGEVLDFGGIFDYALLYNPGTQQHVLASVPKPEGVQYVSFIQSATSIWHTTSDVVAGRQADLRDGATGKLWVRFVGEQTQRDAAPVFTTQGNTFTYDQGYSQYTGGLVGGSDLTAGDDHVLGLHVGLLTSSLDFEDSGTNDKIDGAVFGAYGGWWNEAGLSLDGALNANFLQLEHELSEQFEESDTDIVSLGARVEAGWRLALNDAFYVQPLATTAYVHADIDDVPLQDNDISFENTESLRAALGVRLGGDMSLNGDKVGRLSYWLTARAWDEQIDDGQVRFAMRNGDYLAIVDDRSGTFEEVNFGINASNQDDTLSAYFSGGAMFGDDTDSYNVSIGARLNW